MTVNSNWKRGLALFLLALLPGYTLPAQQTTITFTQTVTQATPGVGLTSSLNPSTYTASVTLTATVPTNATGSIQFKDGGSAIGTQVSVSSGSASLTTSTLSVGLHGIVASYSGDNNYTGASSSPVEQTVNKATSSTVVASSSPSSSFTAPVTFTATVTTPAAASGSVTFTTGGQTIGVSPLSSGQSSITTSALTVGVYPVIATYSGDGNYLSSASSPLSETITQASVAPAVTSSTNASVYSYPVTFTATLPATATGTVSFLDGASVLLTTPLVAGNAAYTTAVLSAGSHAITVSYSGDSNNSAATSTLLTQVVNKDWTISEVAASPNSGVKVGQNVTFTALVDTGSLLPTGTVQFLDGSTVLGSAPVTSVTATNLLNYSSDFTHWTLIANAVAVPVLTPNSGTGPDGSPNTASVLALPDTSATGNQGADYSGISQTGAGSFAGSPLTYSVWLSSATPGTVTLALADGSGSVQNTSTCSVAAVSQRCVVTANFSSGAAPGFIASVRNWGAAAENVNVYGGQVEQAATAGVFVRTTGASASGTGGTATFSTTTLLTATHDITTAYSGDANYLGSTSAVNATSITAGSATISLASNGPNSIYGQSVTFSTTVTGTTTIPTGVITFHDGATSIGTGTLDATGKATFTTSTLLVGSHTITASYGGDTEYTPIVSAPITQTVAQVAAVIGETTSENPSVYGDSVTFHFVVTGTGIVPTGSLTVTDGATTLATVTLDATGAGSFTTSTLVAGTHSLTVVYSGDQNYK